MESYDNVNRLSSVADTGYTRSFSYDAYGNGWVTGNTGVTLAGNTPTANVFNGANQLAGVSYDAAGNQLSVNGATMAYDAENRQTAATDPPALGGGAETYLYDGAGQRVEKNGASGTAVLVYDALGRVVAESSAAGASSPCATCYLVWDHLGTTRLVTDQNAFAMARHDYLPFGEEIPAGTAGRIGLWGPVVDNLAQKFTGEERDQESALDYFGARYYGSALGRFSSPDPSNLSVDFWMPQTWNRYAYVLNNPLSMADRNGLWPFYIHKEIINEAFPGMSSQNLKQLRDVSWNMDYAPGQQNPAKSFEHGMRDGSTNQDPMQAQQQGDDFIAKDIQEAQKDQADWIAWGHTGLSPKALTAFGNALHTVTDRTSPAHTSNQPWYNDPWWNKRTRNHFWTESKISPDQMNNAVNAARYLFNQTFGNEFDWMMLMMKSGQACVSVSDSASHSFFGDCQ